MTASDQRTHDGEVDGPVAARRTGPANSEPDAAARNDAAPAATGTSPFPTRLRTRESAKQSSQRPPWWTAHHRGAFR